MSEHDIDFLLSDDIGPTSLTPQLLDQESAWWGHVPFAFWVMAATKPRVFVELGTHRGVSFAAFCECVLHEKLETKCYAVDTWTGDEHAGFYSDEIYDHLKHLHDIRYAAFSTMLRKTFDEATQDLADGTVDLLHIDGYHTYEAVRHDFETWLPKLSDRAVVLFHDTDVRRNDFGVWRFFEELRQTYPCFEFVHCCGLGVAVVGPNAPDTIKRLCGLTKLGYIERFRARFADLGSHLERMPHAGDVISNGKSGNETWLNHARRWLANLFQSSFGRFADLNRRHLDTDK